MEILKKQLLLAAILIGAARVEAAAPILLVPKGAVEIRSAAAGAWTPVAGPTELSAGQAVRTDENASAELKFSDGSRVVLAGNSEFRVDRTDGREAIFTLSLGKLRAAFSGLFSSLISIHTPVAVCAVRGTVFELGANAKGTEVSMAEGVLEVKDVKGNQAVVTSEETLKIGEGGMGKPQMLALSDARALEAVRPMTVHAEMARDATRSMLEDLRHRELKASESMLGKDVVDAFGRRVRLEEYLLRPTQNSFELLFLSRRQDRFDWGHLIERFNSRIPDDLSQVPAIISGTFLSRNRPSNWLKYMEFYATNVTDAEKEAITLGDPVQIDFSGYGAGLRWYPASIDFVQTLMGPGVPGGSRVQFQQHQDYGQTTGGLFTWTQSIVNNVGTGSLALLAQFQLNPANAADVAFGGCLLGGETCFDHAPAALNVFSPGDFEYQPQAQFNGLQATVADFPSGTNKADYRRSTTYPDGSSLTVEKFLVSNDGKLFDTSDPGENTFTKNGNYNLEINIQSNLFQGRDIDVLIAPEILQQKKAQTTTPDSPNFMAQ